MCAHQLCILSRSQSSCSLDFAEAAESVATHKLTSPKPSLRPHLVTGTTHAAIDAVQLTNTLVPCAQYTDQAANPVALTLQEFLEPGGAGTGDLPSVPLVGPDPVRRCACPCKLHCRKACGIHPICDVLHGMKNLLDTDALFRAVHHTGLCPPGPVAAPPTTGAQWHHQSSCSMHHSTALKS